MTIYRMEEVESEEKKEKIDDSIYENYETFNPYIQMFEELVGPKNEANWRERYLKKVGSESYTKIYRVSKGALDYELSVSTGLNGKFGISCEITIR